MLLKDEKGFNLSVSNQTNNESLIEITMEAFNLARCFCDNEIWPLSKSPLKISVYTSGKDGQSMLFKAI